MSDCDPQIIGAYHDGELSAAERLAVEDHLRICAGCTRELAELRDVSRLLGGHAVDPITSAETRRLHEAVDAAADRPLWRLFGAISAVAASILIVSAAWLAEMPTRSSGGATVTVVAPAEAWERVAITLKPDPIDHKTHSPAELADASLAGWMLEGIETSGQEPEVRSQ